MVLAMAAIAAVVVLVASFSGACSLLVESDADQCGNDVDCERMFPGKICSAERVCIARPKVDGGNDGAVTDTAAECWDDAGFGGLGCYRCTPTTNDQLLNACTKHAFLPFDNAARIAGFDETNPRPTLPPIDSGIDAATDSPPSDVGDGGSDAAPSDGGPPGPPACPALSSLENPVVFVGSTGLLLQPTIDALGHISIISEIVGSCDGVNALQPGGPQASGTVTLLRSGLPPLDCTLDKPYDADLGAGGLFWDSCNPAIPQPPDLADLLGAVNPIGFIAPAGSGQHVISAEAAYKVYGFGAASGVDPWIDESVLFRRNATSANQNLTALAIGLPVDRFLGIDTAGGGKMITLVSSTETAKLDRTLGFSSSDQTDKSRLIVKVLAYRHEGQRVGFHWDSEAGANDRRAVRDGHYFIWAPIHVFGQLAGGDIMGRNPELEPLRPKELVRDLALYLTVRKPLPRGIDIIAALKDPTGGSSAIPYCAMSVTRRKDSGPLEPYTPPRSCGCAFEAAPPGVTPPECKPCNLDSECPSTRPVCSFGFCEVN
jgi:hypothetical protein